MKVKRFKTIHALFIVMLALVSILLATSLIFYNDSLVSFFEGKSVPDAVWILLLVLFLLLPVLLLLLLAVYWVRRREAHKKPSFVEMDPLFPKENNGKSGLMPGEIGEPDERYGKVAWIMLFLIILLIPILLVPLLIYNRISRRRSLAQERPSGSKPIEENSAKGFVLSEAAESRELYGRLKDAFKEQTVLMLFENLNAAMVEHRMDAALELADYIIAHAVVADLYSETQVAANAYIIEAYREYPGKVNLNGIRREIRRRYGKNTDVFAVWSAPKGEKGMPPSQIARELAQRGVHIRMGSEADIFFEMNEQYRAALEYQKSLKQDAGTRIKQFLGSDIEAIEKLRQVLAIDVMRVLDETGRTSEAAKRIVKTASESAMLKEVLRNAKIHDPATNSFHEQSDEIADEGVQNACKRFFALCELDENREKYGRAGHIGSMTLAELCERFCNFAADKLRLYYHISDIRKFIAGLSTSYLVILQGISGTGKTSLAYALGEFLGNPSTVIPVQPMWKERSDLIGYYNEFTKRFNETTLLQKMYEANYSNAVYLTLLDEMNIARIEYYFAEFLSLLELPDPDKRFLSVVSDRWETDPAQLVGGQIKLPENMWFIGTSNNDDTTFAISDKVFDRAMILNLDSKAEVFDAPKTERVNLTAQQFRQLKEGALAEYEVTRRNLKRLDALDKYITGTFHITFGNRIRRQILTFVPVYLACGGDELEALDDIIAKKLIRKLEMQNPIYVKNSAEGFCAFLDELFGQDKMKQCKAYITRLTKNA